MTIIRVSKRERFVIIDKTGLEDERLSFKAKGLLAFLLSKPDDWRINYRHLQTIGPDRERAVLSAMRELVGAGYLRREPLKLTNGRFGWEQVLYETPPPSMPTKPLHGVSHADKDPAWETSALNEEGSSEPPNPPPSGGPKMTSTTGTGTPRSRGTSPRALRWKEQINKLHDEILGCNECAGVGWTCSRCDRKQRQIADLKTRLSKQGAA